MPLTTAVQEFVNLSQHDTLSAFNSLTSKQKDAAILMEARDIINKLKSSDEDDWAKVRPETVRHFQYIAYSAESGNTLSASLYNKVVNCIVAGVKVQALMGARVMVYPKDLDPAIVDTYVDKYPNEPYKALL